MKIGAFAKQNGVGIDTVRHYMDLELLIPQKAGKQYEFDLQCQKDFEEILYLKSLGFSLLEIKNIFLVRHLGAMTSFQQMEQFRGIFRQKQADVRAQIEALSREASRLESELRKMETAPGGPRRSFGVDLASLRFLCCGRCGKPLHLHGACVDDDRILSGRLTCECGTEYTVRDGILFAGGGCRGEEEDNQLPDVLSYMEQTDEEYLKKVDKTIVWTLHRIDFGGLAGKVLLEPGVGSGFLLRRLYGSLPESAVYFAVDRSPVRLRFLKSILEKAEPQKNVALLCCDFSHIPLKERCVDAVCDFSGSTAYAFEHPEFLLDKIDRLTKPDAELIGSYIVFRSIRPENEIPQECRPLFRLDPVKKHIAALGFQKQAEYLSEAVDRGGIYESYFSGGEQVQTYSFVGKRPG